MTHRYEFLSQLVDCFGAGLQARKILQYLNASDYIAGTLAISAAWLKLRVD